MNDEECENLARLIVVLLDDHELSPGGMSVPAYCHGSDCEWSATVFEQHSAHDRHRTRIVDTAISNALANAEVRP